MFEGNRVNKADIEAVINTISYLVIPDTTTTICTIRLDNGYTVRGEASCVDPLNYDKDIGEQFALEDAKRKIWPLLGFRLADQMNKVAEAQIFGVDLGQHDRRKIVD